MAITLDKALEIIILNLFEAGRKMPPDVKLSLMLAVEAMKRLRSLRCDNLPEALPLLNGEEPEEED